MANNYKNAKKDLTDTNATTLYTCPSATVAIVNSILVSNDSGSEDTITLTITDGDQKAVLKAIAEKMTGSALGSPFVVVADEDNGIFCHSSITAVETVLAA